MTGSGKTGLCLSLLEEAAIDGIPVIAIDPKGDDPISTEQAKAMIDDLAAFGAPVMLFSGGEPLVREDLVELASYATGKGMRAVISTNGTLITKKKAKELKEVGLSYVGISLDGAETIHDQFRGVKGSYKKALEGVANCQAEGLKVGLRFTINKRNAMEIPHLFDLIETMEVPRICFYHLVYAGRGSDLMQEDLSHQETREAVDLIIERTKQLHDKGKPKEVLTVDNHADGPYLYLRLLKEDTIHVVTDHPWHSEQVHGAFEAAERAGRQRARAGKGRGSGSKWRR